MWCLRIEFELLNTALPSPIPKQAILLDDSQLLDGKADFLFVISYQNEQRFAVYNTKTIANFHTFIPFEPFTNIPFTPIPCCFLLI